MYPKTVLVTNVMLRDISLCESFNLDTDHHKDKTCSRASPMQNTYMVVSTVFIDLIILGTQ